MIRGAQHAKNLKIRYGLTIGDYERILEAQGGGCGACGRTDQRLCVDHCHKTGSVRGILCLPCNTALGVLENAEVAQRLDRYLSRPCPVRASFRPPETRRPIKGKWRVGAALLALCLLSGCNASSEEQAIDAGLPLRTQNGQLALYFSRDIGPVARFDALDAAEEHLRELQYGVAPLVVTITGVPTFPSTPRRVFVHSRPYLTAPHAQHQAGYVDLDVPGRDVHVILGPGAVLPDLLHQLVHAEWYPYEVHDQAPTYVLSGQRVTLWSEVLARQAALVGRLKFARGVP